MTVSWSAECRFPWCVSLPGLLTILHLVLMSEPTRNRGFSMGVLDVIELLGDMIQVRNKPLLYFFEGYFGIVTEVRADWYTCALDNLPLPLQIHSLYLSTLLSPERLPCVEDSIELLSSFIPCDLLEIMYSCKVTVGWLHPSVKITVFAGSPLCVWCLVSGNCSLRCSFSSALSLSFIVFLSLILNPSPSLIHILQ